MPKAFPPPGLVATLARHLYSGDERVREGAAYYFGRSPNPQAWLVAVDVIREAMEIMAPDAPALMHLATALGRLRDPEDGVRLIRLLEEAEDWRIRTNAARGLAAPEFLEAPGTREALWQGHGVRSL
jgi:HEAT repeat protein